MSALISRTSHSWQRAQHFIAQQRALVGFLLILAIAIMQHAAARAAISVTPHVIPLVNFRPDLDGTALANALISGNSGGITITSSIITAATSNAVTQAYSHGYYSVTPGSNYGLTRNGIVLSTGNVLDYTSGPSTENAHSYDYGRPATAAHNALMSTVTGRSSHKDVAALELVFNAGPTTKQIDFDLVFGSEEYPEYVNNQFIDGMGLFVNGKNIAFSGGKPININHPAFAYIKATELDAVLAPMGNPVVTVSAPVKPGSVGNTLKLLIADTSDGIFDSTVYISSLRATADLSVNTLRNFDVVSPSDIMVNDFHIKLKGLNRPFATGTPETPDYQGGQIGNFYPTSNLYGQLPPGWAPESIATDGTDTTVKWGPGQMITGQKLHFGVRLTPDGEAACQGICMTWTQNGVPVYSGANPNLPLTVTAPHPRRGEATVQIVNQACPEQSEPAPPRWISAVRVAVLPVALDLADLLPGSPLMMNAPVITDGPLFLPADEIISFSNVDANSPIDAGSSIVVWYDVFADAGGSVGPLVGTSFTAFNIVPSVPEPHAAVLMATAIAILSLRRRKCPVPLRIPAC